jgi:inward rectifier potassium channel
MIPTMAQLGSTRVFGHSGGGIVRIGLRRRPLKDVYHWLVTGSWARVLVVYGAIYFAVEALFGVAHFVLPRAEAEATSLVGLALSRLPGSPVDPLPLPAPLVLAAGVVFGIEGFLRWLLLAVGSGLIFAKFSLLKARVLFSRSAVVAPHAGGQALMFRMANERTSHVVDAKVQAMLVVDEPGEGGEIVRRAHDLPLARGGSALFSHAWTAIHPIDRDSPLAGRTAALLEAGEAEVIVTLSGYDEGLTRVIHARHVYRADQIRWNARFRDVVRTLPNGMRAVDYRRFHEWTAAEGEEPGPERTPRRARGGA